MKRIIVVEIDAEDTFCGNCDKGYVKFFTDTALWCRNFPNSPRTRIDSKNIKRCPECLAAEIRKEVSE